MEQPIKIVFTRTILCFLKAFIIRRYFIFGFDGFVDSVIFAFARFARLAKTREFTFMINQQSNDKKIN